MKIPAFFAVPSGRCWLIAALLVTAALGWRLGLHRRLTKEMPAASIHAAPVPPTLATIRSKLPLEVQSWLDEIARAKTPSAQVVAAARLAARLQPEEWPLLLTHLEEFSPTIVRDVLEAAVVWRWVADDPAAAANWGIEHRQSTLAAAAAAGLVRQEPAAAVKWFDSLTPQQRYLRNFENDFYMTLMKEAPELAVAHITARSEDSYFRFVMVGWQLGHIAPESAVKLADQVKNESLRASLREGAARELGQRDPLAAVAWARQQPDAERMLQAVFEQVRKPPVEMIPVLASLTAEQQEHVRKSWSWWERGDPLVTLETLRHPPEGLTEESRRFLTQRALSVLTRQYDPADAAHLLTTEWADYAGMWERLVAGSWTRKDTDAARAWIEQLPEGPGRDKARQAYEEETKHKAQQETLSDPVASAIHTLSQPAESVLRDRTLNPLTEAERRQVWERSVDLPEGKREAVLANLITLQAVHDPAEAAAWLTSRPEAPPSPELASRLAANWALDDAPAAARWVASLPAGEAKTWALWNLTRQWQRVDAKAAQRWAAARSPEDKAVMESAFAGRRP